MGGYLDNWRNNPSHNAGAMQGHFDRPRMNLYPPDFEIGWEHFKSFHSCYYCGNQDHESNLVLCEDGHLRHQCCEDFKNELYKNMKP